MPPSIRATPMKNLKRLTIFNTKITPEGIARIRKAIPRLSLDLETPPPRGPTQLPSGPTQLPGGAKGPE